MPVKTLHKYYLHIRLKPIFCTNHLPARGSVQGGGKQQGIVDIIKVTENHIQINAPAKINLFLQVLNRREDGYHNIHSLFQAVSLYDCLDFIRADQAGIEIEITNCEVLSSGSDNLVARAYEVVREEFGLDCGLSVKLQNNIPLAAGLGGGSAEAAATILACNALFDLGLSRDEMMGLGLQVGSDLPFFFSRGQAMVSGRGEIVEETYYSTDYVVVLVNPKRVVSTSSAYSRLKRGLTTPRKPFNLAADPRVEEFVNSLQLSGNDFEEVHVESYPEMDEIRDGLLCCGAELVRMTGSGPTMYGVFFSTPNLTGGRAFQWEGRQLYTVMPITFPSQA